MSLTKQVKHMAKPARKKGAPPVGLYIKVGPDIDLDWVTRDLREIFFVINNSNYERNMHALEISGRAEDPAFREKAKSLCDLARNNGIACLLRNQPELAKDIGTDGVLLDNPDDYTKARELFGDEGIVGLVCGASPEKAAAAYDAGADFVSFGTGGPALPNPEALKFWTLLTDKPALVEGEITNDYCAWLIEKGASLIDASHYLWGHGKGLMQATSNMLYAIELAVDETKSQKPS